MRDLPRGTQVADLEAARFAYGAITLYGTASQQLRLPWLGYYVGPTTPHFHSLIVNGFGLDFAVFARR